MFLRALSSFVRGNRLVSHVRLLCSASNVRLHRPDQRRAAAATENFHYQFVHQVEQRHGDNMLVVQWKDKSVSRFPYVYLRDLCTCSKCINRDSLERLTDTVAEVPLDIKASNVTVSSNGETIQIHWLDHHLTEFESMWLYSKKLPEKDESSSSSIARKGVKFWDRSEMQDNIPRFEYSRILEDDQSLFEWLHTLHSVGIALLDNVPVHADYIALETFCKRVGYTKSTQYGHFFDIFAKFDANNLGDTAQGLPLHCDLPHCEYYPGVQFLRCLEQTTSEGGANMFVDGFHIAQEFKRNEPDVFELLSVTSIPYWDIGKDVFGDFHLKYSRPVFELDYNGKITRFTYSNIVRDYYLKGSPEKVKQIYKSYMKMGMKMRDPTNRIDHKLKPGQMITLNNSRVLHGRTAYTPTQADNRHMQGSFFDWDLVYARLRSLGKSLGKPFQE